MTEDLVGKQLVDQGYTVWHNADKIENKNTNCFHTRVDDTQLVTSEAIRFGCWNDSTIDSGEYRFIIISYGVHFCVCGRGFV